MRSCLCCRNRSYRYTSTRSDTSCYRRYRTTHRCFCGKMIRPMNRRTIDRHIWITCVINEHRLCIQDRRETVSGRIYIYAINRNSGGKHWGSRISTLYVCTKYEWMSFYWTYRHFVIYRSDRRI